MHLFYDLLFVGFQCTWKNLFVNIVTMCLCDIINWFGVLFGILDSSGENVVFLSNYFMCRLLNNWANFAYLLLHIPVPFRCAYSPLSVFLLFLKQVCHFLIKGTLYPAQLLYCVKEKCKKTSNQKCLNFLWTGRELNPRPLPCQGSDLPLIYRPMMSNLTLQH